jgi:hypothetical protein
VTTLGAETLEKAVVETTATMTTTTNDDDDDDDDDDGGGWWMPRVRLRCNDTTPAQRPATRRRH